MASLATAHPLPPINDTQLQDRLFIHRSMPNIPIVDARNNERLAFLGDQVVHMCVTDILYERLGDSSTGDLDTKRSRFVSVKRAASWSDSYDLARRLKAPSHQLPVIQSNKAQKAQLFRGHLAAAFLQDGYNSIRAWLKELMELTWEEAMEEDEEEGAASQLLSPSNLGSSEPSTDDPKDPDDPFDSTPLTPSSTAYGHNPVTPPRYPEASDPREPVTPTAPEGATPLRQILQAVTAPPPPPMSPAKRAVSTLHERCAQMRIGEPVWSDQKEGRDNNPIFTVTVRVDAHVTIYGEGKAGKKQVAKELAAQAALDDPGWS